MKNPIVIAMFLVAAGASAVVFSDARLGNVANAANTVSESMMEPKGARKTMRAFASEQELKDYFKLKAEKELSARRKAAPNAGTLTNSPESVTADASASNHPILKRTSR